MERLKTTTKKHCNGIRIEIWNRDLPNSSNNSRAFDNTCLNQRNVPSNFLGFAAASRGWKWVKPSFREQSVVSSSENCVYSVHTKLCVQFPRENRCGFRNGGLFTVQPPDAALTREHFIEFSLCESFKLYVKQIYICIWTVLSLGDLVNTARLE